MTTEATSSPATTAGPPGRYAKRSAVATVVGFFVICAALGPGAIIPSYWWDDYTILKNVQSGNGEIFDLFVSNNRPVGAVIEVLGFGIAGTPSEGWLLRLLGLTAILLTFLILAFRWMKFRNGSLATYAAAAAFCLPSFQIYAYWATGFGFAWSMVLCTLGWLAWERLPLSAGKRSYGMKCLGVALIATALLNYPPTAFFFFAIIAVEGVAFGDSARRMLRRFWSAIVLTVLGLIVCIAVGTITIKLLGTGAAARTALVTPSAIGDKLIWIIKEPIAIGLRPFMVDYPTGVGWITVVPTVLILGIALIIQARRLKESWVLRIIAVAAPLLATLGLFYIIAENYLEFRFIPGLVWGIGTITIFVVLAGLRKLLINNETGRLRDLSPQRFAIGTIAIGIALLALITLTNVRYYDLIRHPYEIKTQYLTDALAKCRIEHKDEKIVILQPANPYPYRAGLGLLGSGYGVGAFSLTTDLGSSWVPVQNVQALDPLKLSVTLVERNSPEAAAALKDNNVCVIDLEPFRQKLLTP